MLEKKRTITQGKKAIIASRAKGQFNSPHARAKWYENYQERQPDYVKAKLRFNTTSRNVAKLTQKQKNNNSRRGANFLKELRNTSRNPNKHSNNSASKYETMMNSLNMAKSAEQQGKYDDATQYIHESRRMLQQLSHKPQLKSVYKPKLDEINAYIQKLQGEAKINAALNEIDFSDADNIDFSGITFGGNRKSRRRTRRKSRRKSSRKNKKSKRH